MTCGAGTSGADFSISSGKADLIVVWKLDRAFRSVVDGANTLQSLRSGGCGIRSLQEPWIDTTTPIGEAMYHITIAWAQLEKRQLMTRMSGRCLTNCAGCFGMQSVASISNA